MLRYSKEKILNINPKSVTFSTGDKTTYLPYPREVHLLLYLFTLGFGFLLNSSLIFPN